MTQNPKFSKSIDIAIQFHQEGNDWTATFQMSSKERVLVDETRTFDNQADCLEFAHWTALRVADNLQNYLHKLGPVGHA